MMRRDQLLNAIVPQRLKSPLKAMVSGLVPSLRHLDMKKRLAHLRTLGFDPGVIYDIGAAQGTWSQDAAGLWPSACIHAFEPNPSFQDELRRVGAVLAKLTIHAVFVGKAPGTIRFNDRGTHTSAKVDVSREASEHLHEARVVTLDELVGDGHCPQPDFIKIDVQGAELDVLQGAERVLEKTAALLIEVNFFRYEPSIPLVHEVIGFLADRGFVWHDIMGVLRRPYDDSLGQMDLFFLKQDHLLRQSNRWQ